MAAILKMEKTRHLENRFFDRFRWCTLAFWTLWARKKNF